MANFGKKLYENHDLFLDGSSIARADEDDILRQRLNTRLQFLLAEWFLDTRVGLPYTQEIFEAGTSLDDIYVLFRNEIINTEGVKNLVSLELTPFADDRILRVAFSVNDGTVADTLEVSI